MCEVLRAPWIFDAIKHYRDVVTNIKTGEINRNESKFAQLIECQSVKDRGEYLALLSDKEYKISAIITPKCCEEMMKSECVKPNAYKGGIIKLINWRVSNN